MSPNATAYPTGGMAYLDVLNLSWYWPIAACRQKRAGCDSERISSQLLLIKHSIITCYGYLRSLLRLPDDEFVNHVTHLDLILRIHIVLHFFHPCSRSGNFLSPQLHKSNNNSDLIGLTISRKVLLLRYLVW